MENKLGLSEAEYMIMSYFWEKNCEMFPLDVKNHFAHCGLTWTNQRVSAILSSLVQKGALAIRRQGHQRIYYAAMNKTDYTTFWLKGLIEYNFTSGMEDFVVALKGLKSEISDEQRKELETIWNE